MKKLLLLAALCGLAPLAQADNPRVLFDTDFGPLVFELDEVKAPLTVANFLAYVDGQRYDNTLFHRAVNNFVVQGGEVKADRNPVATFAPIASERNNGLSNTVGALAMALSAGTTSQYNLSSARGSFFINTGDNSALLDPNFTVFGRVLYGMKTLQVMNANTVYSGSDRPVRPPLVRRAVRTQGFPILDLHTGAWFDPAKSGRGFSVEVSNDAGSESGPLLIVYWYDYFEGRQVWMNGAAPFEFGDNEVTLPMQITSGGQFGAAFDPAQVQATSDWGSLTVRFTSCSTAEFSYTSSFGNGSMQLQRITLPRNNSCAGQ